MSRLSLLHRPSSSFHIGDDQRYLFFLWLETWGKDLYFLSEPLVLHTSLLYETQNLPSSDMIKENHQIIYEAAFETHQIKYLKNKLF